MQNYFEILEIPATLDKNTIREAYKIKILQHAGTQKSYEVRKAWSILEDDSKRKEYFEEFSAKAKGKQPEEAFEDKQQCSHDDEETDHLSLSQKIRIFIPLLISKRNRTSKDMTKYDSRPILRFYDLYLSISEVTQDPKIGFEHIGWRISKLLANMRMRVGVDTHEVLILSSQHDYYKRYRGFYAVEAFVDSSELIPELLSERDLHGSWGNSDKFLTLKQHTNIASSNIKSINHVWESKVFPKTLLNNSSSPMLKKYTYSEAAQLLRSFLDDKLFWSQLTHDIRSFPEGVVEMQKAMLNPSVVYKDFNGHIVLEKSKATEPVICIYELNMIAKKHFDSKPFFSSFFNTPENKLTLDFYKTVMNAGTIYEIADWIDLHYKKLDVGLRDDFQMDGVELKEFKS